MHNESVASIKGLLKGRTTQEMPREGTQMRELFDLFYNNKGRVVDYCTTASKNGGSYLAALTDIYGLDIRRIKKNKWCLVGEWFGKDYVDYLTVKDS